MRRTICSLLAGLMLLAGLPTACAEALKQYTVRPAQELPELTVTVTDTGNDTPEGDHLLCAAVAYRNGDELQQLLWQSVESPAVERIAPLVTMEDMNFDGFGDLLLLHAQGARNVFWALALWDEEAARFRPVEQQPEWDAEAGVLTWEASQLALCNYELAPEEKALYSVVEDGYRYRTETVYRWESRYGLTVGAVADVYDAGHEQIGERVVLYATQALHCWDQRYPESWYYSDTDTAFERLTALRYLTRGDALREPALLQVANVDWVNLRSRDSKLSPSLAKLNAGEIVYALAFGCGPENGWTLVWQPGPEPAVPGLVGYIWHSYLENADTAYTDNDERRRSP